MISIRRTLLVSLLIGVLIVGVALSTGVYFVAREEIGEVFDYHLQQLALSLRDHAFPEAQSEDGLEEDDEFDFIMQVWTDDGQRVYGSHPDARLFEHAQRGIATVHSGSENWRVFSVEQRGHIFQAAQPLKVRRTMAWEAAAWVLLPVLAAIPLFGLFIWVAVGRGLYPLRAIASAVQARSPDLLDPIEEERTPTEIRPLVGAINRLLRRLANALSAQLRFVADAAHELRTPLTALQLQAQLAEGARTEAERITAFAALHESLKREAHLVEQLLALARQEPDSTTRTVEQVDLDALARLLIEEKLPLAEAKRIDLGMVRSERAAVRGDANALRIMLRNLIDNAIRYTLEGGRVDVAVAREADCVILEVSDTGPGIPSEERERVFDRFYRSPGNDVPTGSGLGLAIVKTVVEKHDGTVVLTEPSDHSGLLVRVSLPAE